MPAKEAKGLGKPGNHAGAAAPPGEDPIDEVGELKNKFSNMFARDAPSMTLSQIEAFCREADGLDYNPVLKIAWSMCPPPGVADDFPIFVSKGEMVQKWGNDPHSGGARVRYAIDQPGFPKVTDKHQTHIEYPLPLDAELKRARYHAIEWETIVNVSQDREQIDYDALLKSSQAHYKERIARQKQHDAIAAANAAREAEAAQRERDVAEGNAFFQPQLQALQRQLDQLRAENQQLRQSVDNFPQPTPLQQPRRERRVPEELDRGMLAFAAALRGEPMPKDPDEYDWTNPATYASEFSRCTKSEITTALQDLSWKVQYNPSTTSFAERDAWNRFEHWFRATFPREIDADPTGQELALGKMLFNQLRVACFHARHPKVNMRDVYVSVQDEQEPDKISKAMHKALSASTKPTAPRGGKHKCATCDKQCPTRFAKCLDCSKASGEGGAGSGDPKKK